jgi:crossover junction endodeoxyribonuclease RuvC
MYSRIIAIDPGYDRCGVAIIDSTNGTGTLIHSTCITTDKKASLAQRLTAIYNGIEDVITKWHPEALALETLFFSVNKKTAIAVAEARGVVLLVAGHNLLPIVELSPQEVKMAMTGVGNATKDQVQRMVALTLKINLSEKLDDEIDAIAVGFAALGKLKVDQFGKR